MVPTLCRVSGGPAKVLDKRELWRQRRALETINLAPRYLGDREDRITAMQTRGNKDRNKRSVTEQNVAVRVRGEEVSELIDAKRWMGTGGDQRLGRPKVSLGCVWFI